MTASYERSDKALYRTGPAYEDTFGPEVGRLCAAAGFVPDPEQQLALDAMFGVGRDGKAASFEFAIVAPRQNLKTGLLKMAVLGWLFVTEQHLITWSAHEMSTTLEAFRDLRMLIEGYGPFRRRLAPGPTNGIYEGNGKESFEFASGQRLKFKARTHVGGRGLTGDKVILDEAMYLQPSHLGSLLPTLAVVPDPQVAYAGSAGLERSESWREVRDRGRPGGAPRLAYVEYGAPVGGCEDPECMHPKTGAVGCALDDEAKRREANPSYGGRLRPERLQDFRRSMPPHEFAREFLSWWEDPLAGDEDPRLVKFRAAWPDLADPSVPVPAGPTAVALEVAPDRASTSIAVAWWLGQRVMVMSTEVEGTGGVPAAVVALRQELDPVDISLHAGGQAGPLLKRLNRALRALPGNELEVRSVSTQEAAQATGMLRDLVEEETLGHLGQVELAAEAAVAVLRNSGDGEIWDRKDESAGSIENLFAVTLAAHGLLQEVPEGPVEIDGPLMVT